MNRLSELTGPGHHVHLVKLLDDLDYQARCDDWTRISTCWRTFEAELAGHMEDEERLLLPAFGARHRAEADAIRAEHQAIRARVAELGVGLDLHQLRTGIIEQLIAELRAHARHEDLRLYRWISNHVAELNAESPR
jgi:hypothetical protein